VKLTVVYTTPAELVTAHDAEMTRGGLLVRGASAAGLELFTDVDLELRAGDTTITTRAQVVQIVAGVGVAVAFMIDRADGLAALVTKARTLAAWPAAAAPAAAVGAAAKWAAASQSEKIQIALHGNRDERALVLRDINKMLHPYVLRNPNLQLDEIVAIAKMNTVSPELLKQIADRREWYTRPEIAIALVRNPKVPPPIAVRLLDHVSAAELRQLAKDSRTRPAVQQAARKKVIGP
jgi:hypothetical protein